MINVYVKSGEAINLGREGTKGVRRVIFDFTRWAREYGEGSVQLIVMRHGDTSPYPVALIIDGEEAVWEVGAADTAIPGEGECEWQYFVGEALEKSETFKTFVENAMGEAANEAPEAAQGWVEQVLEAAAKAETAIKKAPIIFADTWWIWDAEAEEYVDTGVSAKGETPVKGEDYFTAEDKQEIVEQVIEEMPEPSGGIEITNTAAVGQTVKITAIDADGKPTEWEAVDFPVGGAAIVDVVELPTENIDEDVFYRVVTASFVFDGGTSEGWTCHAVDSLPEVGEPVTDAAMSIINAYYNKQDGAAYGYLDSALSAALGVPAGWYDIGTLLPGGGQSYGGVISNISESDNTGKLHLLVEQLLWEYCGRWRLIKGDVKQEQPDWNQNDENQPDFVKNRTHYTIPEHTEIEWDGDMTGRLAIPFPDVGYSDAYLVKVSDNVYDKSDLYGMLLEKSDGHRFEMDEDDFADIPGGFAPTAYNFVVIRSARDVEEAFGLPEGTIQNGTYFIHIASMSYYTKALIAPQHIAKLDKKYMPSDSVVYYELDSGEAIECTLDGGWAEFDDSAFQDVLYAVEESALVRARVDIRRGQAATKTQCLFTLSRDHGGSWLWEGYGVVVIPGLSDNPILVIIRLGVGPRVMARTLSFDGDVYSKAEIDAIMGSYINDIAAIVGGDA